MDFVVKEHGGIALEACERPFFLSTLRRIGL